MDEQESDEELTAQVNAVLADEAASRSPEQVAEEEALEAWLNKAGRRAWDMVEWKERDPSGRHLVVRSRASAGICAGLDAGRGSAGGLCLN